MEWPDILALPQPAADKKIAYGKEASQYGELRLPKGATKPYPVVVLIHGGCWSADYALDHVRLLAAAITALGFATWSIEYRRLGEAGGGWPGTFTDVGAAVDYLRVLAKEYPLDLAHVAVAGHSAGGHLALWTAGRSGLRPASEVAAKNPLPVHGVVGLAAIANLKTYGLGQGSCNAAALRLMDGSAEQRAERYRDAEPQIAKGIQVYLIHGTSDGIVPSEQAQAYAAAAKKAGHPVTVTEVPDAGHFDVIAATTPAWREVAAALRRAAL